MPASTNILTAMLRGLTHERRRVLEAMGSVDPDSDRNEEMGLYAQDLYFAISELAAEYEANRQSKPELPPLDRMLHFFETEDFFGGADQVSA